jgi:hypothetical protein
MPRVAKKTAAPAAELEDQELPGLERLEQDPPPRRRPGRPRKSVAAGNAGRIPARTPSGKIASKASMQADVRAQLTVYLASGAALWSLRDPICAAEATEERIETVADGLTAMLSRSPAALEFAAKSGILGDIAKILHAALPVVRAVWRHHGPGGTGHGTEDQIDHGSYPPYAVPAAV